jgi:hypothetical protein
MPQPKPPTTYAAWRKRGRKARVPVLDPAAENVASRATGSFIPPPTREQLMAGSANPRRVYKVEG